MTIEEWGPWIYIGIPPIGIYVRVHTIHKKTAEHKYWEGIMAGFNDETGLGWFIGETEPSDCDWLAERWQKRLLKELPPVQVCSRELEPTT